MTLPIPLVLQPNGADFSLDWPTQLSKYRIARESAKMESFYAVRNSHFEEFRRFYFKDHHKIRVDNTTRDQSGSDEFNDAARESDRDIASAVNLATHMINMAISMSVQESPGIETLVDPGSASQRKRGNVAEQLFAGVMFANSQQQGRNLYHDWYYNSYVYGWGVTFTGWDDSRMTEKMKSQVRQNLERELRDGGSPDATRFFRKVEDDDEFAMPVVLDVPFPGDIYPVPGGHRERWKAVMRKWTMTVADAEDFFVCELPRSTNEICAERVSEDEAVIDVWDYWVWVGNAVWHCLFTPNMPTYGEVNDDGERPLLGQDRCEYLWEPSEMVEYSRLPYEIRFCYPTTDTLGEHFGLSLLYLIMEPIREAEELIDRINLAIDQYADPTKLRYFDTNLNADAIASGTEGRAGETVDLDKGLGQDYKLLEWHGSVPDVKTMLEMWLKLAREMGFDPMIEGTTGLDSIIKKSGILAKLTVPIRESEQAWAATYARVVTLLVRMLGPAKLKVQGQLTVNDQATSFVMEVSGTQLKGMNNARFTVVPRFPYEELQNGAAAITVVNGKIMSRQRAMSKFMRIEDPDTELKVIAQEDIKLNPAWGSKLVDIALLKLQAEAQAEQQQRAIALAASQPQAPVAPPAAPMPQLPAPAGPPPNQPMTPGNDQLAGMMQGAMPVADAQMVGNPMQLGNTTGMPPPTDSIQRIQGQQNPGRPPGS